MQAASANTTGAGTGDNRDHAKPPRRRTKEADPDARLLRMVADLRAEQAHLDRWNSTDELSWAEGEAASLRWWRLARLIVRTPPNSGAGIRALAEAAQMAVRMLAPADADLETQFAVALAASVLRAAA